MSRTHSHARALACAAPLALLTLSGCIVGQMRDDLRSTKSSVTQLEQIVPSLDRTNELLVRVSDQLQRTNDELVAMRERVASVDQKLAKLERMDDSLANLDQHLASLRRTLEGIDNTIPFLSLVDHADPPASDQPPAQADGAQPDGAQPAAQPNGQPAPLPAAAPTPEVRGVVAYRERIALPPDAVVVATLLDVTDPQNPVELATSRTPSNGRQVPLPFRVPVDGALLERKVPLAVRAGIESEGVLRWQSDGPVPVPDRADPNARPLQILLRRSGE